MGAVYASRHKCWPSLCPLGRLFHARVFHHHLLFPSLSTTTFKAPQCTKARNKMRTDPSSIPGRRAQTGRWQGFGVVISSTPSNRRFPIFLNKPTRHPSYDKSDLLPISNINTILSLGPLETNSTRAAPPIPNACTTVTVAMPCGSASLCQQQRSNRICAPTNSQCRGLPPCIKGSGDRGCIHSMHPMDGRLLLSYHAHPARPLVRPSCISNIVCTLKTL
ncbi:hypothetical protein OF83DRAFT_1121522 [Amylostereum chailletii]|nr:hypothetical protein OF83DRAFT_1121522 [Amylostereum chailletii]